MKIVSKYPDGMFSWIDLGTTDLEAAHAFYSALFGWTPDNQPLPGGGSYTNFRIDGYTVAGAAESRTQRPWPVAIVQCEQVGGDSGAFLP